MNGWSPNGRTMTVAQTVVEFLAHQWTVDGDHRERTVVGVFGILGHGNLAGLGQALAEYEASDPGRLPYLQARNEQAMVHQGVGYARMHRRRGTYAATASVGPGAANMLTGAALATADHLPVLLLVSDTFATAPADPVLQQLEFPDRPGRQVADAFCPLSRFFARVSRPEQLAPALLGALRVLTDPVETGAVTLVLPEDVQTETLTVPADFLADRDWRLRRPPAEPELLDAAAALIRRARRPLIVAGGGVLYSSAEEQLRALAAGTGIPVATTQAGGGVLDTDAPQALGGLGATGTSAANTVAAQADLVVGVGTRYSDFTTGSGTVFADPQVRFITVNAAVHDAVKPDPWRPAAVLPVVADARSALHGLAERLAGHRVSIGYAQEVAQARASWAAIADRALAPSGAAPPGRPEIIGAIRRALRRDDVIVAAAGSLPGDLQKLWRTSDPLGYHVEYGFSCMGYEIAGALGAKRGLAAAGDDRAVVALVGDGGYQMLHSELATAALEGIALIVVVIDDAGHSSIGGLSERLGGGRYGTGYPRIDIAANAASHGVAVADLTDAADPVAALGPALAAARTADGPTVIVLHADPSIAAPDSGVWWEVPVAAVSDDPRVSSARTEDQRCRAERDRRRTRPTAGPGAAGTGAVGTGDG